MMAVGPVDMRTYMEMFSRHTEINRVVEEIPGGVRTTTESNSPDLAAQLQAHVSSMYSHLGEGAEVMCMSQSSRLCFAMPAATDLTLTPTGVIAEETADDPAITQAIRDHAREVTGFVRDGMPAMMQQRMGSSGMMGPGGMMDRTDTTRRTDPRLFGSAKGGAPPERSSTRLEPPAPALPPTNFRRGSSVVRSPSAVVPTAVFACQRCQRPGLRRSFRSNAHNPNKRQGGLARIE